MAFYFCGLRRKPYKDPRIMQNKSITLLAVLCVTLLFGACSSVPKHAQYIPKDALAVLSVNTGAISKEVAWAKITGSKILDDMEKGATDAKEKKAAQGLKNIENSGIDFMNTLYLYTKSDTRYSGSQHVTAVLPIKDKAKWEAWLKSVWPDANIHAVGARREALLGNKAYAAWDDGVAMIMNAVMVRSAQNAPQTTTTDTTAPANEIMMPPSPDANMSVTEKADEPATAADMDLAFKLPKESSIIENAHFKSLMKEGHDVSLYVNYDAAMNSAAAMTNGAMGMNMGATLWQGTAVTAGMDFKNGALDGNFRYYSSDSMKAIAKEFGADNFDGTMASRVPGQNLNMAAGYHLSPKALKMILDKMGYTGLANMYLAQQGFTVDAILSAFTGDVAVCANNLTMTKEMQATDSASQAFGMKPYESMTPKLDYIIALKIGDKAAFDRLFKFVNTNAGIALVETSPGTYTLPAEAKSGNAMMDNLTFIVTDKYFAVGNNPASVQAYLKGGGSTSDAAKSELNGHPIGLYADAQSLLQAGTAMTGTPADAAAMAEVKKLFADFGVHGGEFKDGANEYNFSLRMVNKSENSLLQLVQFAQRMSEMNNKNTGAASNPI